MTPKEKIELFEEKFNRLNELKLIKFMENGIELIFNGNTNDLDKKAKFPDLEMIEAYVLTLRFFIQDNEPISINNISKLYENHQIDKNLKEDFSLVKNILNKELDQYFPFLWKDKKMTYRQIFYGIMYANLVHSNKEQHKDIIDMTKEKFGFGYYLAMDAFLRCIKVIHEKLEIINSINKKAFR